MGSPLNQFHPDNQVGCAFSNPGIYKRACSGIMKSVIFYLAWTLVASDLSAQPFDLPPQLSSLEASFRLPAYFEIGDNNISDGIFLKTAVMPTYEFGKYTAQAGVRFDLVSNNENVLSGFSLMASRDFMIRNFPLDLKGIFIRTGYSGVIHENKWGLLLNTGTKHFRFGLGTSFRTLALNKEEAGNLNDSLNTKIHENWNMIYQFSYYIKPIGNKWNIDVSVTNIDYFNLSQETNPIFKLGAIYNVSPPVTFFIDSGYQSAGIINMNTDYFGFFIKTGIIWNIQKKSN
jgi:hypothetical protein